MNYQVQANIHRSSYDRSQCQIGIVHLGFGAFHRAHQAVYIDAYMEKSGDLNWGIAAVNLRSEDSAGFEKHSADQGGYLLKTMTPSGENSLTEIRPHVHFVDWAKQADTAEDLLCLDTVKILSMTVTESGYYLNDDQNLNESDPVIIAEVAGTHKKSIYAFLTAALKRRMLRTNAPITILCCDNIRANGDKLSRNFRSYLALTGNDTLAEWLDNKATFPNAMIDRITPRVTDALHSEISSISPQYVDTAIHSESFIQWVLKKDFATDFPALDMVGVGLVDDVDPYEETKIRILNGGHTAVCYLGALAGYKTFDQAFADEELRDHFYNFEQGNVLPSLTLDLPFDKEDYLKQTAQRFSNSAIADDLARICMDGWSKFSIFICPTLHSCLAQGLSPQSGYDCIASWYVYARHVAAGLGNIPYNEPFWDKLKPLLAEGCEVEFASLELLWSDMPKTYDEFVPELVTAIERMNKKWPM